MIVRKDKTRVAVAVVGKFGDIVTDIDLTREDLLNAELAVITRADGSMILLNERYGVARVGEVIDWERAFEIVVKHFKARANSIIVGNNACHSFPCRMQSPCERAIMNMISNTCRPEPVSTGCFIQTSK